MRRLHNVDNVDNISVPRARIESAILRSPLSYSDYYTLRSQMVLHYRGMLSWEDLGGLLDFLTKISVPSATHQ